MTQIEIAYRESNNKLKSKGMIFLSTSLISLSFLLSLVGIIYDTIASAPSVFIILILCVVILIGINAMHVFLSLKKTAIIIGTVLIALIISTLNMMIAGFNITLNRVFEVLGKRFGEIYPIYNVSVDPESYLISEIVFWCLTIILLSFFSLYLVRGSNNILVVVVIVLMIGFLSIIKPEINIFWMVMMFLSVILIFCQNRIPNISVHDKGKSSLGIFVLVSSVCVIVCVIFAISVPSFGSSGGVDAATASEENEKSLFSGVGKRITEISNRIRYENENRRLTDGNFEEIGSLKHTGNPQLEIIMSEPDSIYLRGFVGGNYTGKSFENIENSRLYESSDLFYWLHQNSFYGQSQISTVANLLDSPSTNNIAINNIGASSKHIYAPYEFASTEDDILRANAIGDESLTSSGFTGNRFYRYSALSNQIKNANIIAAKLYEGTVNSDAEVQKYLDAESHYNKFVYDTYTEIPEKIKLIISSQLGEYTLPEGEWHYSYGEAKQNILAYFTDSSNVSYSETKIAKPNDNQDFIQLFLEETKEGYDIHFAAAATMMFRYYGIPARYVEGFIITPDDVDGVLSNTPIKINDDEHAHAWTEIYQDGVGWIPFEATPPYIGIMETPEKIESASYASLTQMQEEKPEEEVIEEEVLEDGTRNAYDIERSVIMKYFGIIGLVSIILIALLIICRFLIASIGKRNRLKRALAQFESDNHSVAIQSIFSYTMMLLSELGFSQKNKSLYRRSEDVASVIGVDSLEFARILSIHQEARFSNHEMNIKQVEKVRNFERKILDRLKRTSSPIERIRQRFIRCIYL